MMAWLDNLPLSVLVMPVCCWGQPLIPEPHVWQKLKMLAGGSLSAPIDIFDLLLHGTP